jgi:hypothetical protein
MRAIRESKDPMRTMDAFWRGQILSKEWLITELKKQKHHVKAWPSIDIHGGWVGTLASLLFQSDLYISNIRSIDIDPTCEDIARTMNQLEMEAGKFRAVTADMCTIRSDADIVINTSSEHVTQEVYDTWYSRIPTGTLVVVQGNDFFSCPEHVRCSHDTAQFEAMNRVTDSIWSGYLCTPEYTRFMSVWRK